jgi:hypothetical protein
VNSSNCTFKLGFGVSGGLYVGLVPRMQYTSGQVWQSSCILGGSMCIGGTMGILYLLGYDH